MNQRDVYALSQDRYWLEALVQAADAGVTVRPVECLDGYPDCLTGLPEADPKALFLLDATGQSDVGPLARGAGGYSCSPVTARRLRARGWPHIVVVAADPCSDQARAVLRERVADDYWHKTYARRAIQRDLRQYLQEVWGIDDEQSGSPARG